jgi:hypothetical protein
MGRKSRSNTVEEDAPTAPSASEAEEVDLHGFWDRSRSDVDDEEAFAVVLDDDGDHDETSDAETLQYMGNVTQIGAEELVDLAEWAENKACRVCRRKIREQHDPRQLKHDECRTALRVSRLLRRYN